jgi:hypothetical protein
MSAPTPAAGTTNNLKEKEEKAPKRSFVVWYWTDEWMSNDPDDGTLPIGGSERLETMKQVFDYIDKYHGHNIKYIEIVDKTKGSSKSKKFYPVNIINEFCESSRNKLRTNQSFANEEKQWQGLVPESEPIRGDIRACTNHSNVKMYWMEALDPTESPLFPLFGKFRSNHTQI